MRRAISLVIATAFVVACGSPRAAVEPAGAPSAPTGHLVLAGYETPPSGEAVTEEKFSIVDIATGDVTDRSVAQWGAGDAQFKLEEIGDELVFRGSDGTESGAWAVDPRLEGAPRHIGDSWYFVPSATPGRLWLALLNEPLDHGQRPLRAVREVTLSGEITVEDVDPPSEHIVGALRAASSSRTTASRCGTRPQARPSFGSAACFRSTHTTMSSRGVTTAARRCTSTTSAAERARL